MLRLGFCTGSEGPFSALADYYLRRSAVLYRTVLACLIAITIKCSTSTRPCYSGIVSMWLLAAQFDRLSPGWCEMVKFVHWQSKPDLEPIWVSGFGSGFGRSQVRVASSGKVYFHSTVFCPAERLGNSPSAVFFAPFSGEGNFGLPRTQSKYRY